MLKKETHFEQANTETPPIPQLTLDCVILGFHAGQLKVLLLRWKGTQEWSLLGGPIYQNESLDEAASRVLKERTYLRQIFLKQSHTFGEFPRYDLPEIQKERTKHLIYTGLIKRRMKQG